MKVESYSDVRNKPFFQVARDLSVPSSEPDPPERSRRLLLCLFQRNFSIFVARESHLEGSEKDICGHCCWQSIELYIFCELLLSQDDLWFTSLNSSFGPVDFKRKIQFEGKKVFLPRVFSADFLKTKQFETKGSCKFTTFYWPCLWTPSRNICGDPYSK